MTFAPAFKPQICSHQTSWDTVYKVLLKYFIPENLLLLIAESLCCLEQPLNKDNGSQRLKLQKLTKQIWFNAANHFTKQPCNVSSPPAMPVLCLDPCPRPCPRSSSVSITTMILPAGPALRSLPLWVGLLSVWSVYRSSWLVQRDNLWLY